VLPDAIERLRHKLANVDGSNRQTVDILTTGEAIFSRG
jgi:hypothetical protein